MTILGVLGVQETVILSIFLLVLLPFIFFFITQQNTLKTIRPENRSMAPGEVWLQLIPLFGLVWQFIVVTRIANSIQKELGSDTNFSFEQENQLDYSNTPRPTYGIGIAYCSLSCCAIIPMLGPLASIAGLICWIIYWIKLSEYKGKIEMRRSQSYQ